MYSDTDEGQINMRDVEVIDLKFEKIGNPIVIEGFPSVGLVGAIATEYLATKLNMELIGYVKSRKLPPITLIKDGIPTAPIRVYAKKDLIVFVSDTAVPPAIVFDIAHAIIDWSIRHGAKKIVSIGGIAHSSRAKGTEPTVYGVGTTPQIIATFKKHGIKTIHLGFLTGVYGVLMMECIERGLPAIGFLADAHYEYPDPAAAAAALKAMAKVLNKKVIVDPLMETSKKIEKKMEALMIQTRKAMKEMTEQYPSIYR
jgi:uncharacterized protein